MLTAINQFFCFFFPHTYLTYVLHKYLFSPSCFPCEFLTPIWHLHTLFSRKLSGSFFGSFYSWVSIEEIYKDAHMYGLKSSNSQAVTNSSLAIAWLEATFPELVSQAKEGGSLLALKARPYVPFDASLALQVFFFPS